MRGNQAHTFARQWQKTFDAISDGVCLLDRDGTVRRCNRAFCDLTGRSFAQVIGVAFADLIAPTLGLAALPVRHLGDLQAGVVAQTEKDGRWFRVAADPVLDDDQVLTGAVLILSDITRQKQVEEAMRRSNEELLRANRIKDEFLATLSHELRTPLNAIVGWTRLLRSGHLDEQATARALETIDRNAGLQAKLVEDLLDVSRIITGKLRLRVAMIDPIAVVEAAINSVRPAADAKAITIETSFQEGAGFMVADADRLQQVVWNLLANAIKFTPNGGRVMLELRDTVGGLLIEVRDTGRGIEPEFLPFVFDRFRQADSSTTRHFGGLGLGLALVRYLVELHGGTVQAMSEGRGQGATFQVTLPWLAELPTVLHPVAAAPAPTAVPVVSPPLLSGLKLLVVDDESDARELLAAAFTQLGATVQIVDSVEAALQAIVEERPHVVVSDIGMPGQDGYSLVQRLRDLERARDGAAGRLPAIALTAYATADDVRRALDAGYDLHVAKPVDAATLARAIADLSRTALPTELAPPPSPAARPVS